jgi:uncharacterized membrane protein
MRTAVIAYVATAVVFLAMDFVWLSTMVGSFYRPRMADLLLAKPNLAVGGLFYLIYVVGVVAFVVLPALRGGGWTQAAWSGALLGLVGYATYDMTNLATIKGFPASVAAVDMVWGMVVTGVAGTLGMLITSLFARAP